MEKFLQDQKITYTRSSLESGRLMIRFGDVAQQLRARDAIAANEELSKTYSTALSFATRAPEIFTKIGLKPMPFGLDLRGGLYLLYQVDTDGAISQVLENYSQSMRRILGENNIAYNDVVPVAIDSDKNNAVRVLLAPGADPEHAREVLTKTITDLPLSVVNLSSGPAIQGVLTTQQIRERQDYAITKNIETLRNRVNELGVSEPIVQRQGNDRINVQLPACRTRPR